MHTKTHEKSTSMWQFMAHLIYLLVFELFASVCAFDLIVCSLVHVSDL